jgi:GNAT superfamily N-acetyltransferase
MLAELASRLPDLPRWVETRGMLLSGRCELLAAPGPAPADFVVRGTDFGLSCVAGEPPLTALAAALEPREDETVLCLPGSAKSVGAALPGWKGSRGVVHALAEPEALGGGSAQGAGVRVLSPRDAGSLEHVPEPLREELLTALSFTHVAAAFADGLPVSFCYGGYETETLWDVSVDTLEGYRKRGLGRACCEFLIDHMFRHGKQPVWGAVEQNVASMRMAESLGFVAVDELVVFERAGAA